jgi:alanine racemase
MAILMAPRESAEPHAVGTAQPLTAPRLWVDLDGLAANVATLRGRARGLLAVVKADAFGHGDVADHLLRHGADGLGTTSLEHAVQLRRRTGARTLAWLAAPSASFDEAVAEGVDIAVSSLLQLRAVAAAADTTGQAARVHLHIDLGMARDGAPREEWDELATLSGMLAARGVLKPVGVMGHLSHAAHPGDPHNVSARLLFDNAVRSAARRGFAARVRHIASTAATLHGTGTDLELVRVGAGLYGIDPSGTAEGVLRPTLGLEAPVTVVRDVRAGTGVGYRHDWVADRATRLATLPVGYADGISRSVTGRAEVLVRGRRAPIVGAVSMDQTIVDVGDAGVEPGESVTILGDGGPTLQEWARWAGTIEHEIVTGLGSRWEPAFRGGATCA